MSKTVAEVFVGTLKMAGVERVYGVPGDSLNAFTESIRAMEGIDWVGTRNEEVAAFAAGAESQISGKLAVCAGSCGPGNLHLINGLHDCHRSRTPVLAIAAQIPSAEIGTGYFQETHPEHLFRTCSHFCEVVSTPEQIPRVLAIAMRTAIAMRGVAVIIIPGDIAEKKCESEPIALGIDGPAAMVTPSEGELQRAAEILNESKTVTILAGIGCAGAREEAMQIAAVLQAPMVVSLRGKEALEAENQYFVGLNGLLGMTSGYRAMEKCETLLMLGTDFPYAQFYPEKAKVIQIDVRGEQIGRRRSVDLGLIGAVRSTVQALLPLLKQPRDATWLTESREHYTKARETLDEMAMPGDAEKKVVHPQYLMKCVSEAAAANAIFTCDVGTPTSWAARYLDLGRTRRLLGSFVHGSMASALPQAIGAQCTHAGRQVVSLSGDGGLSMLMGDMLSLRQLKLPVKIVLFNNNSYSFVEQEMKAAGIVTYGTELVNPDFAKVASAMGMFGVRVETPEQIKPALAEAFAHEGPALVEVLVNRQELAMPPTVTAGQAVGFNLYMMKAILSGSGEEVVDMAKTNLWR